MNSKKAGNLIFPRLIAIAASLRRREPGEALDTACGGLRRMCLLFPAELAYEAGTQVLERFNSLVNHRDDSPDVALHSITSAWNYTDWNYSMSSPIIQVRFIFTLKRGEGSTKVLKNLLDSEVFGLLL
jgi:hypothetical protein